MAVKILCADNFTATSEFAINAGLQAQTAFQAALTRLVAVAGERNVELYADFAPHSFGFVILDGEEVRLAGGLIYSGPGQRLDSSAPTYTVSVESPTTDHQWSLHT